jgi:hypothetical protein
MEGQTLSIRNGTDVALEFGGASTNWELRGYLTK